MELEDFEKTVRGLARLYAPRYDDVEDLEQIGRITVWQVLEKKPDAGRAYMTQAVRYSLWNYLKSQRAKKRRPEGGLVSFSTPSSEEGRPLEEIVGSWTEPVLEGDIIIALRDNPSSIPNMLKVLLGPNYVRELASTENAQSLVRTVFRTAIEDVAQIRLHEIPKKANYALFVEMGLQPLLWAFYRNSPFSAINDAYRGEFVPWDFSRKPANFWTGTEGYKHAVEAMQWMAAEKGLRVITDCRHIGYDDFEEMRLGRMLQTQFNWSPFLALKTLFPGLRPWQTRGTTRGYFDDIPNRVDALVSFVMEHDSPSLLGLTPEETYATDLKAFVKKKALEDYGLNALIAKYNGNMYWMFSNLFPEQMLPWTLNAKEPWKEDPRETAANAVRWLFEKYLGISQVEIPHYASYQLFRRVRFSGILTNRRIGFNSSPYAAIDNAYPGCFKPKDFRRTRRVKRLEINS